MPFGLKNAGATYQQLMNRVFQKQTGRNLEVYVDEILIKSLRVVDLCADIEETFRTLRTYDVKLNPQKCLFGAKSGRFLGYIVTERGIDANPCKVKALQDMPPPRNMKEVQRLTGWITALSRFISKTVDWSLPFFKILRRAAKFQWDQECDQAFEELNVYLNSLPVLAKPAAGEPLRIYLSSTEQVVGSALVRQNGEEQPVYFLNHILKDVESRYTGLEKLAFALVLAARRLRPYFLVHTIIVMTNNPLGRVLLNLEASGRLIKWTTELSEFDIQYQPRTVIKAQFLADFITEVQNPEQEASWRVYVDGSSTRLRSGVEYEALIAGLQAARHVGASRVIIFSDSQLTARQLSGAFEVNNARLKLYVEAFERLKTSFGEVVVQKIPRADSQATNELVKLASSITPIDIQQAIEQLSLVAHIDRMEGHTFPSDWRTSIIEYLGSGATPSDQNEAQLLRRRAGRFTLIGDQLYKKAFSRPFLKCISSEHTEYILKEVHQGSCGGHPGGRSLARKILLATYFWPTLQEDAARTVATCLSCQKYHIFSHRPTKEMKASTHSEAARVLQWAAAHRTGAPRMVRRVRHRTTLHLCGIPVEQRTSRSCQSRDSSNSEDTTRPPRGSWVDELPGVLWALCTTPKEGTGATPFHLVYEGEAVVPIEVGIESDRVQQYDADNTERRQLELDLVDEARAKATVRLMAYRQRMKQNYNRRVIARAFQVGDLVWKKVKPAGYVSKLEAP
ncbi:uncharacterized protein LOC121978264 [Zingiber officinale]|uniref:uncharacterized protein LOC121978264 n=1 Tax=Zingiber officinale TaxID=94328 RepID=UPI001C4DB820|nr:uncharacterized protein LOC121978264 [Zingiber officinale]